MRWLVLLVACGCATLPTKEHDQTYQSNTTVANSLLDRMGVEPSHGQVTLVVASRFVDKLLQASIYPDKLVLSVEKPGTVWKEQVQKLAFRFENQVALTRGKADIDFNFDQLVLHGDLIALHGALKGHGVMAADMTMFGAGLQRDVEIWTKVENRLQLHLEKSEHGWLLRSIGPPFKIHVDIEIPALTVGVFKLFPIRISRELEVGADAIGPFDVPSLTPQTIAIGPTTVALEARDLTMGIREGLLWVGADLSASQVSDASSAPAPPAR